MQESLPMAGVIREAVRQLPNGPNNLSSDLSRRYCGGSALAFACTTTLPIVEIIEI
jgi:hypothetical protein